MTNKTKLIEQTKTWVSKFIIHHNICPFAERVYVDDKIDYQLIASEDIESSLLEVVEHLLRLSKNDKIETALLIFPNQLSDFDDYLEFLAIANQLIEDHDFDNDFQLASFHPNYCFQGEASTDPANYSNRSPTPMLHIIRQKSIATALTFYKNPEAIPEKNIKLLRNLGEPYLNQLKNQCLRNNDEH